MKLFCQSRTLWIALIIAVIATPTFAQEPPIEKASDPAKSRKVDVDKIKQKYWARGKKSELGVVQNRLYSKSKKIQFGLMGGINSVDPFLSVRVLGGNVGYHFNEFFGVHLLGWKNFVSNSSALNTFQDFSGGTTNTNEPQSYIGVEGSASLIYGKLSLLGLKIIYYDLHTGLGAGMTNTESGNYITPSFNIGQRFFLTKILSLRLDYRLMYYNETIVEKTITTKIGQEVGTRNAFSSVITLGVDFLFGGE